MAYGLLVMRVVVGLTFAGHGAQKIFGWFGGGGPRQTAGFFGGLGFRAPLVMAVAAGVAELSGLLLAVGFATPFAAAAVIAVMVVAIATVHWKNGFWVAKGGFEFNLVLTAVAAGIGATGAGRFSVDRALAWEDNISGLWWGVGALGLGALGAGAALLLFRSDLLRFRRREPHPAH